jgi:hypothetical protein
VRGELGSSEKDPLLRTKRQREGEIEVRVEMKEKETDAEFLA